MTYATRWTDWIVACFAALAAVWLGTATFLGFFAPFHLAWIVLWAASSAWLSTRVVREAELRGTQLVVRPYLGRVHEGSLSHVTAVVRTRWPCGTWIVSDEHVFLVVNSFSPAFDTFVDSLQESNRSIELRLAKPGWGVAMDDRAGRIRPGNK
jgi:hypothetical protein